MTTYLCRDITSKKTKKKPVRKIIAQSLMDAAEKYAEKYQEDYAEYTLVSVKSPGKLAEVIRIELRSVPIGFD